MEGAESAYLIGCKLPSVSYWGQLGVELESGSNTGKYSSTWCPPAGTAACRITQFPVELPNTPLGQHHVLTV